MVENQALNEQKNCGAVHPFADWEVHSTNTREPDRQDALCLLSVFDGVGDTMKNYPVTADVVKSYKDVASSMMEDRDRVGQYTALTRLSDHFNQVGHYDGDAVVRYDLRIHGLEPRYVVSRADLERIVDGR